MVAALRRRGATRCPTGFLRSTSSPSPSARKSSTFLRGETTPGDGQSVPQTIFVGEIGDARNVAQQRFRRNAGDVEHDVGVAPRQEERGLAVQRTAGVREDDRQPREVVGDVIDRHRIGEDVARPRKNRRAGVKHDRHAAVLALAIDLRELPQVAVVVRVRRKELVRRMELDHADAEVENAADLIADVDLVQRIH